MSAEKKLIGKRVLITGAASGIGRSTALLLAQHGAKVAINYHPGGSHQNEAYEVCRKISEELNCTDCKSLVLGANVGNEQDVIGMFMKICETWGGLDILINNAGIQRKVPSVDLTLESFNQVFSTNAIGTLLCSREALKIFLEKKIKGVIINNTSVHEHIPKPQYLSYSMSKGAILNLTHTLALEYAHAGIRVNNVAPGAIITPINPWANDEVKKERIAEHIPLGRVGEADEIARAVLFLASDDSSYMTGQTMFVDGGLTLYPDFGDDWSSS